MDGMRCELCDDRARWWIFPANDPARPFRVCHLHATLAGHGERDPLGRPIDRGPERLGDILPRTRAPRRKLKRNWRWSGRG